MNAVIIRTRFPYIVPDPLGGWYVVYGSFGWLFGDRLAALRAVGELTNEVRR